MGDKIELMMSCRVLQSNFTCLSQSELRTQTCHVRIVVFIAIFIINHEPCLTLILKLKDQVIYYKSYI